MTEPDGPGWGKIMFLIVVILGVIALLLATNRWN